MKPDDYYGLPIALIFEEILDLDNKNDKNKNKEDNQEDSSENK